MDCVIYARVSTKEQQTEGYSIPAQLKAIRAFCAAQGLSPVTEFVETESAGRAGRTQFGRMLTYLEANPTVRVVVAHKLDRLYRNFSDQIALEEERGVRARYVVSDIPEGPQGELLRDVNLSVAKFYLANLREEVKKGMEEKVAQRGWPHRAPLGYVNDKASRTIVVDPEPAEFIRLAFRRYATGTVSIADLADELFEVGFRTVGGKRVATSVLHHILTNPIYAGRVSYRGVEYPGNHEALVSDELFEAVQVAFEPKRNGVKSTKHVFALRGYLSCGECGCKITAERQKGYAYYRCTHGKGKDACTQRRYTREEELIEKVAALLATIELDEEIVQALVTDSRALDREEAQMQASEVERITRQVSELDAKASRLLDGYLEGAVPVDAYRAKADEIAESKRAFERRLAELQDGPAHRTAQVESLARTAQRARLDFDGADDEGRRRILALVLSNATLLDGDIEGYQLKHPFEFLRRGPEGAFEHSWWAILGLNRPGREDPHA